MTFQLYELLFLDEDEILFLLDDFIGPTYESLMKRKPPPSMLGPPAFIQKSKDKENEFTHIPNKVSINNTCQSFVQLKGSLDQSHFIYEINLGKNRIRHRTTVNSNLQSILSRSRNS